MRLRLIVGHLRIILILAAVWTTPAYSQDVMPLWHGAAPGSEAWTFTEQDTSKPNGDRHIADVTTPTMTVYLPDCSRATGTAVLIAPGGGMVGLEIPSYDGGPAKWFNERGIAAFVLKYRVLPTAWQVRRTPPVITEFRHGNANPFPDDARMSTTIAMAIADARQALRIIRGNAESWGIDPAKVGMLGYSAGGGVAIGAAVAPATSGEAAGNVMRPDFIISAYGPSLVDVEVPENPPPLFLAVKQYHPNVARGLMAAFDEWTKAKAPAELHVYDQLGSSPFLDGTGEWLERAHEWMKMRGFGMAPSPARPAECGCGSGER